MRKILVIGIGAGDPEYLTIQAVNALNQASVFFVVGKGDHKSGLLEVREEICRRYIRDQTGYRIVEIADPPRDRGAAAYEEAVADWREQRAVLFERAITKELGEDQCGAFLVWGDPSLYDSTLGVLERVRERGAVTFDGAVIPGITSVQALAARHRLALNRIGEPVHITTARRLSGGLPDGLRSAIVMLDPRLACADFDDPDLFIYWGAYLGTKDEALASGRLVDVAADIAKLKQELKARHGWIMDTYLLRQQPASGDSGDASSV
jgi:precorrin-6A synthase